MNLKEKKLDKKRDKRGWLAEVISDKGINGKKLGQILIVNANKGQTRGMHYHKRKTEWYCLIKGKGLLRVWNNTEKKEVYLSENRIKLIEIPVGYFHSIKNVGDKEMILLAIVSEAFDEKDPDTYYE